MPDLRKPTDQKEKWWNEWPLEGPENRWAVFFTKVASQSTRLIGWDNDRVERRYLEWVAESLGKDVADLTQSDIPEKISFGFVERISEEITKRLLNIEIPSGDGDDTKKLTLRDIGGERLVDKTAEPSTIRETEIYKLALNNLQWQRDNYLVGKEYADKQRRSRTLGEDVSWKQEALKLGFDPYQFPFDEKALGNTQMSTLGNWFIPSKTVQNFLLPMILALPSGSMYKPILKATTSLIPLSQSNLDNAVKVQVIQVLNNQKIRDLIKFSTKGYIANTYVDASRRTKEG